MDTLPPLRALQVFDTLGRSQGVVETARRLGVSPGAVSQQIKQLEDAVGIRLLAKEGKRLRLTEAGRIYHASCAQAFESLRLARAELERASAIKPRGGHEKEEGEYRKKAGDLIRKLPAP